MSYKLVRTYSSAATLEDLGGVRSNITQAASALIRAVRLQSAAAVLGASTDQTLQANALLSHQESLKASEQAQASLAAVRDAITRSNIVLFQWTASQKTAGGLKLGTLFGGSAKSEQSLQGYAIVAGFRTSTLFVGEDLIREIAENMTGWSSQVNKGLGVPTFTIEGAKILYFSQSDLLKEIQASLKASAAQFKNAPALLAGIDQIELDFLSQQLESLSNTGVVQGPAEVDRVLVPMTLPWDVTKDQSGEDYEGWSPFYSVITRTKDVYEAMKLTKGKAEPGRTIR